MLPIDGPRERGVICRLEEIVVFLNSMLLQQSSCSCRINSLDAAACHLSF